MPLYGILLLCGKFVHSHKKDGCMVKIRGHALGYTHFLLIQCTITQISRKNSYFLYKLWGTNRVSGTSAPCNGRVRRCEAATREHIPKDFVLFRVIFFANVKIFPTTRQKERTRN